MSSIIKDNEIKNQAVKPWLDDPFDLNGTDFVFEFEKEQHNSFSASLDNFIRSQQDLLDSLYDIAFRLKKLEAR